MKTIEELRDLISTTCYRYKVSRTGIAERIGISKQALSNYCNGHTKVDIDKVYARVAEAYPDASQTVTITHSPHAVGAINSQVSVPAQVSVAAQGGTLLRPVLPVAAYRLSTDPLDYCREHQVEQMEVTAQLSHIDLLLRVVSPAMEPLVDRGDLVAVAALPDGASPVWGQAYVVSCRSGVLMRRVYQADGGIELRADNLMFPAVTVPEEEVIRLFVVVGVLRSFV